MSDEYKAVLSLLALCFAVLITSETGCTGAAKAATATANARSCSDLGVFGCKSHIEKDHRMGRQRGGELFSDSLARTSREARTER